MADEGAAGDICAPLAITMQEATLAERPGLRVMAADSPEVIAQEARRREAPWAWVDGFVQAGKSVFASRLAAALGWEPAIHLDHMTLEQQPDSPRYADHLDRERIQRIVAGRHVVIEGVCTRDIVEGMRPEGALRVYVARVSRAAPGNLIWHDGVDLQDLGYPTDNWLVRDVLDYHRRVRPHATSDFVLVRVEDD